MFYLLSIFPKCYYHFLQVEWKEITSALKVSDCTISTGKSKIVQYCFQIYFQENLLHWRQKNSLNLQKNLLQLASHKHIILENPLLLPQWFSICLRVLSDLLQIHLSFASNSFHTHFKFAGNSLLLCFKNASNLFCISFKIY